MIECLLTLESITCSSAGTWHFCYRRWLNPLNVDDRVKLNLRYNKLCFDFPAFSCCSKSHLFEILATVSEACSSRLAAAQAQAESRPKRGTGSLSWLFSEKTGEEQERSADDEEEVSPQRAPVVNPSNTSTFPHLTYPPRPLSFTRLACNVRPSRAMRDAS